MKWIDVKERQPKLGDYYYCMVDTNQDNIIKTIVEWGKYPNDNYDWDLKNVQHFGDFGERAEVIAWLDEKTDNLEKLTSNLLYLDISNINICKDSIIVLNSGINYKKENDNIIIRDFENHNISIPLKEYNGFVMAALESYYAFLPAFQNKNVQVTIKTDVEQKVKDSNF